MHTAYSPFQSDTLLNTRFLKAKGLLKGPVWARERCRISPSRFLAECCKRQLNQGSFVLLCFRLFTFSDLFIFSCTVLCVSISQVIGCEDRLQNDLYCVEWGVKLYSNQATCWKRWVFRPHRNCAQFTSWFNIFPWWYCHRFSHCISDLCTWQCGLLSDYLLFRLLLCQMAN